MNASIEPETEQQIGQCADLLNEILGEDLLGVYLYGSAVVGGLNKYSDVDLLAVVGRATTRNEKARIAQELLHISGVYLKSVKRSVEMTLVVQGEVNPWRYPPMFDFQYGDWLREQFENGIVEPWASHEMPDLALLLTQVRLRSETVYGAEPDRLLAEVPYDDFMTATTHEIDNLVRSLEWDTRNVLLTLARMWSTVETDAIRSKPAAAAWTIERLPPQYRPVMQRARAICLGVENKGWEDLVETIQPCVDYLVTAIKNRAAFLSATDTTRRSIRLAEE